MENINIDSAALQAMFKDPNGPVAHIIEQRAIKCSSIAKILVQVPGSGRYYPAGNYFINREGKVYHWVRTSGHVASAPGEPPASDTGRLLTAITHRIKVGEYVYAEVVANVLYAIYLELGTRYMDPRPFLRPALAAAVR